MSTLSKETRRNIRTASKTLRLAEEEVLERASRYYLDAVKGEVEMQREFDLWERTSDEALAKSTML